MCKCTDQKPEESPRAHAALSKPDAGILVSSLGLLALPPLQVVDSEPAVRQHCRRVLVRVCVSLCVSVGEGASHSPAAEGKRSSAAIVVFCFFLFPGLARSDELLLL